MATLDPSPVKFFPEDSIEKKVYDMVHSFSENIPVANDRNRLAFSLLNYLKGEGDVPLITVKNCKLKLTKISEKELAEKLNIELINLK